MLTLALLLLTTTSAAEPAAPSAADVEFFESKVRPLLVERCENCHSTRKKKDRGGLLLDSRGAILKGGDSGPSVVPGEPDKSLLIKAVRYKDKDLHMPPSGKLAEREIATLEEWVRRGVVYPGPENTATVKQGVNLVEGRKFWSFQPPQTVAPPQTRDRLWAQRPIDNFVLAELEKRNLAPSPAASRRTLIRRAYFDLLGLPPTPEEIDAFVSAPADDAYEKLIEKLLASPQHGERWGRYWLDLARYADVTEGWTEDGRETKNKGRPHVYRDWVVQALNDDMPYDRFVQLQLAADLIPGTRGEDLAALGFLGLSPAYWKELKLAPDVIQTVVAEEWEERIQTVGGTFLGLTIGCARCHDHKFDPIPQQDYYALAGVFASTRAADRMIRPEDVRIALDGFRLPALTPTATLEAASFVRQTIVENRQGKILFAPGVEDSSLFVMPDGTARTKLVYRPGMAQDVAVQIRGNPSNPGVVVPRRFLSVLSPEEPRPFREGSGRRELAKAIVTEGAPLAARVIVNRVWKHHFGAGLVETPSDFGAQGLRPTHPQLLDDLTARFVAHGWSLKWLHREIMLSAAYRQASQADAGKQAVDPDNKLLWRMNRRRLEVESWRDAMLAVNGTLNPERGGPSLDLNDAKNQRRTLYATIKRRELSDMLRLHDVPDATTHSPARVPTTTPLQQLFTLNSPFMQQQSAALVKRLKTDVPDGTEARVKRAYLLLYGRSATEGQVRLAVEFLTAGKAGAAVSDAMWAEYAQVLLGSNEFAFVD